MNVELFCTFTGLFQRIAYELLILGIYFALLHSSIFRHSIYTLERNRQKLSVNKNNFINAGPLEKVRIPKDKDGRQRSFAFVLYKHEHSVPYALSLFEGTSLYNRILNLKSRNADMSEQRLEEKHHDLPIVPPHPNSLPFGIQNFEHLLRCGHQMFNPTFPNNLQNFYSSRIGSKPYLDGQQFQLSPFCMNSTHGAPSNRNHPYQHSHSSGHKRHYDFKHRDGNYRRNNDQRKNNGRGRR